MWLACEIYGCGGYQVVGVVRMYRCDKRRYIDFLILLIPTPLVLAFLQQHPYFFVYFFMFLTIFLHLGKNLLLLFIMFQSFHHYRPMLALHCVTAAVNLISNTAPVIASMCRECLSMVGTVAFLFCMCSERREKTHIEMGASFTEIRRPIKHGKYTSKSSCLKGAIIIEGFKIHRYTIHANGWISEIVYIYRTKKY